jgi:hypothetical protein
LEDLKSGIVKVSAIVHMFLLDAFLISDSGVSGIGSVVLLQSAKEKKKNLGR